MDEVRAFCRRVLGPGNVAETVADTAERTSGDWIERLAEAVRLCRSARETSSGEVVGPDAPDGRAGATPRLIDSVAAEMSAATARLPEPQRELLALRELLRLSHVEIARVLALTPATVAPLLANARLQLRISRRGSADPDDPVGCVERERALAVLARRQDREPLAPEDGDWLFSHLAECPDCESAHAAMLEASACYRAWPVAVGAA